jgi:RNA polymerase sigma-70 factor (ECF subfamily)
MESADPIRSIEPLRDALAAYVGNLVWDRTAAEDALQEVLLQFLGAYPGFTPGTDFRAWVFRVATLAVYSFNRRHRRRDVPVGQLDPSTEDLGLQTDVGVELELELEEAYHQALSDPRGLIRRFRPELRDAFAGLSEAERAVFLLRSVCDFRYREIADVLDMPQGSVMGHLSRARRKLRRRLARAFDRERRRAV